MPRRGYTMMTPGEAGGRCTIFYQESAAADDTIQFNLY